jgi:predicted peroxiredoxin
MSLLNIVSSGYRATIEEQDDTVVWISQALKNAGAEIDVLLRGAASNYPVAGQSVPPMAFGGRVQKHSPDVLGQVRQLAGSGARIFVIQGDLDERGIDSARLIDEVEVLGADELPRLLASYDKVWHW